GERLRNFLLKHRNAKRLEIILARSVDIPVDDKSAYEENWGIGLLVKADKVLIKSKYESQRPTLTLTYKGWEKPAKPTWAAALIIESDEATIQGLRFRVDACGADIAMTPLLLRRFNNATVKDCSFFQSGPRFTESGTISSIVAAPGPSAETRPTL